MSTLREALEIGLDFAREAAARAKELYGSYPPDGLGRRVVAADRELAVIEAALALLDAQPVVWRVRKFYSDPTDPGWGQWQVLSKYDEVTYQEKSRQQPTTYQLEPLYSVPVGMAEDAQGWQPIETAPKDGSWFLVYEPGEYPPNFHVVHWGLIEWGEHGYAWVTQALGPNPDTYEPRDVTRWMRLPEGPTT
ncbi:hypothetical protein BH09PSE5_BH09PSE5_08400 [soil metagenome]